jgi:cardiolipin synthase
VPLVLARARAGVDVRLLLDEVGSSSSAKGIKPWEKQLQAAGVKLVFYKARLRGDQHGALRFNITHRKLLLADGQLAMEGGTNLGTEFDTSEMDLMVRWRGPIVGDLYKEFGLEWKFVGGGMLPMPQGPFEPAGTVDGRVLVTSTPEGRFEIRDAVYAAIDGAQREILIENQYCWDKPMLQHLLGALHRGVKLKVIVPGGTQEKLTLWSLNMDAVHQLVQAGAEARGFYDAALPEAHLHTKYFAVDDRWVAAGSANGDARSFLDHQELDVVSTEPGFVGEMRARVFDHDWNEESRPYQYQAASLLSAPFRSVLDLMAYLF